MKTVNQALWGVVGIAILGGCSIMPYENEFSCRAEDNYGKCIDVAGAYEEAVTGVERGKRLAAGEHQRSSERGQLSTEAEEGGAAPTTNTAYADYRSAVYSELGELVRAPVTPMVRPPQAMRTLVVSYSKSNQKKRLYMPRYVYTIVEGPSWVMGEYLDREQRLVPTLTNYPVQGAQ